MKNGAIGFRIFQAILVIFSSGKKMVLLYGMDTFGSCV